MSKRRRQAEALEVPGLSEDAAERKRVLNVLAQRRYRKRKREHLAALEKEAEEKKDSRNLPGQLDSERQAGDSPSSSPVDLSQLSIPCAIPDGYECILPPTSHGDGSQVQEPLLDSLSNSTPSDPDTSLFDQSNFLDLISDDALLGLGLPATPSLDSLFDAQSSANASALTWQFLSNSANLREEQNSDLPSSLQSHQTSTFTFPDDRIIDVPTLTLLKAVLTIATRLSVTEQLWDFSSVSPFFTGPALSQSASASPSSGSNSPANLPATLAALPANFRPTPTQRLIPHHPLLDLLPWPKVRDKLIQVFSLPPHLRPAPAADPMGLVTLVYDIEDPTEGLRVSGSDPFMVDMWEVGQLVFQRWWWAFDGTIVEKSNRLRSRRGQRGLVLGTVD
ncbi:hypothetical protein PRK78_002731 [Emydomyces testavorans]|uniref:BZIP domain-containing protein n=1 Tax=Emydomyces testavorans TaxID=2070801 RepID=A0AAF0II41_9EURO|nr:hypothetical protein PRK78_002731 [Emydomyces testavorans]